MMIIIIKTMVIHGHAAILGNELAKYDQVSP